MSGDVLFNALLETLSDTVLILDENQRVSRCGGDSDWVQPSALLGATIATIFSHESALLLNNLCGQLRRGKTPPPVELHLTPKTCPVLADLGLTRNQLCLVRGKLAADNVILVLQDISQQRAAAAWASKQKARDPLTQTYNRKALVPVLNQAIAQSQRYEYNCSLALIDIDGLHRINQRYGRDGGDKVLMLLAAELERVKRTSDFLVRIGDDRFALMLPETSQAQSLLVGERIIDLAAGLEVSSANGPFHFQVSIGIATLAGLIDNTEQIIRRANANLLTAKQEGGNRAQGDEVLSHLTAGSSPWPAGT